MAFLCFGAFLLPALRALGVQVSYGLMGYRRYGLQVVRVSYGLLGLGLWVLPARALVPVGAVTLVGLGATTRPPQPSPQEPMQSLDQGLLGRVRRTSPAVRSTPAPLYAKAAQPRRRRDQGKAASLRAPTVGSQRQPKKGKDQDDINPTLRTSKVCETETAPSGLPRIKPLGFSCYRGDQASLAA